MLPLRTDSLLIASTGLYELKLLGYLRLPSNATERSVCDRATRTIQPTLPRRCHRTRETARQSVVDGEVVAFDDDGRPAFNALPNYGSALAPVVYCVLDVMVLGGRDVVREPLEKRRELLEKEGAAEAGQAAQQPVRTHTMVGRLDEDACRRSDRPCRFRPRPVANLSVL